MTLITYDGKTVAADTWFMDQACQLIQPMQRPKIIRKGSIVYGSRGMASLFEPLIAWYEGGANPEHIPNGGDFGFLVFREGRCFGFCEGHPYPDEQGFPDAWGLYPACHIAIGAMEAGKSAEEAVRIAMRRTPYIGGEVTVIDLSFQKEAPSVICQPIYGEVKIEPGELHYVKDAA